MHGLGAMSFLTSELHSTSNGELAKRAWTTCRVCGAHAHPDVGLETAVPLALHQARLATTWRPEDLWDGRNLASKRSGAVEAPTAAARDLPGGAEQASLEGESVQPAQRRLEMLADDRSLRSPSNRKVAERRCELHEVQSMKEHAADIHELLGGRFAYFDMLLAEHQRGVSPP